MINSKWPWFERTFDFDFPVEMASDIIERVRGTPVRARASVEGFAERDLKWRQAEGTWSIQENIGHLVDLEKLWYGRVEDILNGAAVMRDADLTNRGTFDADHNGRGSEEILHEFSDLRKQLVARFESLDSSQFALSAWHPRLREPMRIVDLCLFVADHDDYHLAQISRLKRQIQRSPTH